MAHYHIPVMLNECIQGLNIAPNGVYVDVTFGGGGHSAEILKKLKRGKLVAFDQDADALENLPKSKNLIFVHHNFKYITRFLRYHQINKINGLLADLGVSSHHFDTMDRGFSFRENADLDMRMNQDSSQKASDILNEYDERALTHVFKVYGELKNAYKLAKSIVAYRCGASIIKVNDLLLAIEQCLPARNQNQYLAKVFQALRIELNGEMDALQSLLEQSGELLCTGGRLVVMSYHSLEDRMVKNYMKTGNVSGEQEQDIFGNTARKFKLITRSIVVPTNEELQRNNRARSAKLRIAEKI